jgi:hypothetical protein
MRRCLKCKIMCDDASFHPNAPASAWCRPCIDRHRRSRVEKATKETQQAERDQRAIRNVIKQFQSAGESFVYLLEAGNSYKVGYSKNIDQRVRAFNTAAKTPCRIIAIAPGGRKLERTLHSRFFSFRISREWFSHSSVLLNRFQKLPGVLVFLPGFMTESVIPPPDASGVLA